MGLGLPYFKFLKKESQENKDGEVGQADFARLQREALESYLVGLIRAVVSYMPFMHIIIFYVSFADVPPCR